MKLKLILFGIVLLAGMSLVQAQPPQGGGPQMDPGRMAQMQTERMTTDLSLNEKQQKDVKAINEKYAKKMGEIFQSGQGQGDWQAIRTKFEEMNNQKNEELKKVLTADQYKKYEELEKKRMEGRRQRMGGGRPNGDPTHQRGGQRGGGE